MDSAALHRPRPGLRSAPGIRRAGRFGDFSYGIYLRGFPIQQVVFGLLPKAPLWLDIIIVAAITGAIAIASWHLLERPALDFARKDRVVNDPALDELRPATTTAQ